MGISAKRFIVTTFFLLAFLLCVRKHDLLFFPIEFRQKESFIANDKWHIFDHNSGKKKRKNETLFLHFARRINQTNIHWLRRNFFFTDNNLNRNEFKHKSKQKSKKIKGILLSASYNCNKMTTLYLVEFVFAMLVSIKTSINKKMRSFRNGIAFIMIFVLFFCSSHSCCFVCVWCSSFFCAEKKIYDEMLLFSSEFVQVDAALYWNDIQIKFNRIVQVQHIFFCRSMHELCAHVGEQMTHQNCQRRQFIFCMNSMRTLIAHFEVITVCANY